MNDYNRIAKVIRFVDQNGHRQPRLGELAELVQLSPHHFHRMFTRWAGVTPKSFLQNLTLQHARQRLVAGESVLDAALNSGLSGPGRLHDLCVTLEAASPGEIKSGGADCTITAGFAESPFGLCLVASTTRGVCHLSFVERRSRADADSAIRKDWPLSVLEWDDVAAQELINRVCGESRDRQGKANRIHCIVQGSAFQVRVWRALLQIPSGSLVSYGKVAEAAGQPEAARAVGTAVSENRIALLIPCHRVIRSTGAFGQYRWGTERKRAIHISESAR